MSGYRQIEHTADIGIDVEGASLKEFFINAARGMSSLMFLRCGNVPSPCETRHSVSIKAGSKEELLVKWLEEILYLFDVGGRVAIGFEIEEIMEVELRGVITACAFNPEVHALRHQIKAVTYHGLAIKEEGGRFSAIVIFDI